MTEYGARLPRCGVVYIKSYSLETITKWIAVYSVATPLELVTREYVGDIHNAWH
jgi:hypothetical protein